MDPSAPHYNSIQLPMVRPIILIDFPNFGKTSIVKSKMTNSGVPNLKALPLTAKYPANHDEE